MALQQNSPTPVLTPQRHGAQRRQERLLLGLYAFLVVTGLVLVAITLFTDLPITLDLPPLD